MIELCLVLLFAVAALCTTAAGFIVHKAVGLTVVGLWALLALVVLARRATRGPTE